MHDSPALLAHALRNFGTWLYADVDADAAAAELLHLNATRRTIVLFAIVDDAVQLVAKPAFFTTGEMMAAQLPIPLRARLYREAIEEASRGVQGHALIGLELEDGHWPTERAPLFAFQKPFGSNSILLPDVDFLQHEFYEAADFDDALSFWEKQDRAVFVGSSTGVPLNRETVDRRLSWRVRSALHFKAHPFVDFRLANLVMCDTPEIEAELRALGLGGAGATWQEQFGYRYILSMDGNGATCSRVALALKSHSVLVKYESIHQLHYFACLEPWLHYVPVSDDRDIETMLALAHSAPEFFAHIGHEARDFYRRFLTRAQVMAYMRMLLTIYRQSGPRFARELVAGLDKVAQPRDVGRLTS